MLTTIIRQRRELILSVVLGVAIVTQLVGCGNLPARKYDTAAAALGLARAERGGDGFVQAIYVKDRLRGPVLHVYLEGDGTPWVSGRWVSADPTPRRPLALELLARDPQGGILVGRPCYHGHAGDLGCGPELWTDRRYGERVLASFVTVIEAERQARGAEQLWLVGYSGGGTLAYLLADRLPAVSRLVTLAGNLDTDAWTARHGYLPLAGSFNPATRRPLPPRIHQVHYLGERDQNVPPGLFPDVIRTSPGADVRLLAGFSHGCCWVEKWPELLNAKR